VSAGGRGGGLGRGSDSAAWTASSSAATERSAAAAGLFSSWARPAESLHRAQPRDRGADDRQGDVGTRGEQLAERPHRNPEHLRVSDGRDGRKPASPLERRDLALERSRTDDRERDAALARTAGDLELTVEDDEQRIGLVSLPDEQLARLEVDDLAASHELAQGGVLHPCEEWRLPQPGDDLVDREVFVGHS
jgi:hypothetical protein